MLIMFPSCFAFPHVHVISMKQVREEVKKEDVIVKDKMKHQSQTDAAKGFGGKYGVQTDRKDKVKGMKY